MNETRQWKGSRQSNDGLYGYVEERNRMVVRCESFEREMGRYIRPLTCGGKSDGRYKVGED